MERKDLQTARTSNSKSIANKKFQKEKIKLEKRPKV
jgi:hypothetical protein